MKQREIFVHSALFLIFLLFLLALFLSFVYAVPVGPSSIVFESNQTRAPSSAYSINISGGYITTINITSRTQNLRWKGFVGRVSGSFALQDAAGSTLFDWSLTTVSGEVYATRNSSTIYWSNITCANKTILERENFLMNHTSPSDNISRTFNDSTHKEFWVASVNISANLCNTSLNVYSNNASNQSLFEEVALYDKVSGSVVYASLLESKALGFDSNFYDFQMIVPENGLPGWSGITTYYLYVELT